MKFEGLHIVICFILCVFISKNYCQDITRESDSTPTPENVLLNTTILPEVEKINATFPTTTFSTNATSTISGANQQTTINQTGAPKINETKTTDFIINVDKVTPPGADWNKIPSKESSSWWDESLMKTLYLPVVCGVSGAVLIVFLISVVKCLKRRRKRRVRLTKKIPPLMKPSRPNDRMMLLAESSDEEF